jgi:4-amino-4-deoxy-L-arabinose transferase-like glycosyltransferase
MQTRTDEPLQAPTPTAPRLAPVEAPGPSERALLAAALALAAGLILSYWRLHADNNDASLYVLLARRLVADGSPFQLWSPPAHFAVRPFYEHPPLFFWVEALALRFVHGLDLRLLGAACGLVTVASTFAIGRAVVGARASFYGCLVLVATDAFSNYQPLARLDPPLTAAFAASVALLVTARGRRSRLLLGGLVAGVGALVKGPPALGAPVVAAGLVLATGERGARSPVGWLALVALGAALPPLAFLAYDRVALHGAWWRGYVLDQVVASAAGGRRGNLGPWVFVRNAVVGRFWPGLPLAALALARAAAAAWWPLRRADAVRVRVALAAWAALVWLGYASAGRPYWWYFMPAYPALALLAGAGLDDLHGARAPAVLTWTRRVVLAGAIALLVLLPAKLLGWLERPCRFGDLPARARALGGTIALVTEDYSTAVIFAEHCACDTVTVSSLAEADRPGVAGALDARATPPPPGWAAAASHGDFALLARPPARDDRRPRPGGRASGP